ncbi:winged helix DNA-binding domain-containing protein [Asanoa sp. WMMD1127]|uniref:winged helix DNA-binding domain-containing protein n=1 Tax=Asanoa sp. WMMD1127 TaxID=3016107 RepID=UPI0024166422|nr:winged helix DNA-binding domain-containing protein [Asanoa sp. WMMD1127]MDG4827524.1 winged helix DNA-binding domain-containing protein [Asanoa sp. WMMD1127]
MGRTLTSAELNRTLLWRQLLLERSHDPLPTTLERMAGLQAQYAPAIYIGLWSRADRVERDTVTRLLQDREIIQGTLLRSTIHVVSRGDYWPWALAVREDRRVQALRAWRGTLSHDEMTKAAATLRDALADGPLKQGEIDKLIGADRRRGIGLWLDLVRQPPSGTWERRRADLYALAEDWVGPPEGTVAEGQVLLVRRYLTGFGPATRKEIATWAGLPVATVTAVLKELDTTTYQAEDGTDLVDLAGGPIVDGDTDAPPRFLPNWDAALLVHARRSGILPEEFRKRIFHVRAPQSFPVFLVDGAVAGTWKAVDGRLEYDEFRILTRKERERLHAEGERLADFHS